MRTIIYLKKIKGIAYRLNKINDTVLNSGTTSQVELVKVLESTSPRNYTIKLPQLIDGKQIKELVFEDETTGNDAVISVKSGAIQVTETTGKVVSPYISVIVNADYTVLPEIYTVLVTNDAIITLPDPKDVINKRVTIKYASTSAIDLRVKAVSPTTLIDGEIEIQMTQPLESKTFQLINSTKWIIL